MKQQFSKEYLTSKLSVGLTPEQIDMVYRRQNDKVELRKPKKMRNVRRGFVPTFFPS